MVCQSWLKISFTEVFFLQAASPCTLFFNDALIYPRSVDQQRQ